MTAADILHRENTDVKLELEKLKRTDTSELHGLRTRVQVLETSLGDRDIQLKAL